MFLCVQCGRLAKSVTQRCGETVVLGQVGIAAKYNRPVSQILGRWAVQQNIAYFPKSENRGRMIENMGVGATAYNTVAISIVHVN